MKHQGQWTPRLFTVSLRVEHRRTRLYQPSTSLPRQTITHHLDCMYVVKR
jgi:hypothetical protein